MSALCLTSLTLAQFRSHARTELALDGRPVAIFGPNGAGKTNILEAISLLSPGRGLRRARAPDMARRPGDLGWKVAAELHSLNQTHEVETRALPGVAREVRIDGKSASQLALGRLARILWLVPSMDRLWQEGAEGRRRFLDRMTMSFEPDHAGAVLSYDKAMRERNRLLRDQVRDAHWYEALERQMAEAGARVAANRRMALGRLAAAQGEDRGAEAFPAADLALVSMDAGVDSLEEAGALAQALARGRARDMAAGRTLVGPHRVDLSATYRAKAMPARECSTGEQKALLISLILANARALAEDFGAAPILLLDEVAAHLDADRRAALYDQISDLGSQAFLTGTGAELFAALDGRAHLLEVTEDDGNSRVADAG